MKTDEPSDQPPGEGESSDIQSTVKNETQQVTMATSIIANIPSITEITENGRKFHKPRTVLHHRPMTDGKAGFPPDRYTDRYTDRYRQFLCVFCTEVCHGTAAFSAHLLTHARNTTYNCADCNLRSSLPSRRGVPLRHVHGTCTALPHDPAATAPSSPAVTMTTSIPAATMTTSASAPSLTLYEQEMASGPVAMGTDDFRVSAAPPGGRVGVTENLRMRGENLACRPCGREFRSILEMDYHIAHQCTQPGNHGNHGNNNLLSNHEMNVMLEPSLPDDGMLVSEEGMSGGVSEEGMSGGVSEEGMSGGVSEEGMSGIGGEVSGFIDDKTERGYRKKYPVTANVLLGEAELPCSPTHGTAKLETMHFLTDRPDMTSSTDVMDGNPAP